MRWLGRLRGGATPLRRQVEEALTQARAGRPAAAMAAVSGHFPQALQLLEELGAPPETAWLQVAAQLRFRAGRMSEAAAACEEALRLYERKGATVPATRARALLANLGAREPA